ncbi:uncharacterized protein BP01DRAFT_406715, partial [Aspergillus saccharolyticus JOP 1030-1]
MGRRCILQRTNYAEHGEYTLDGSPLCPWEASFHRVKALGKSLNTTHGSVCHGIGVGKKITPRNCSTWIIESADQLVDDGMFRREVA